MAKLRTIWIGTKEKQAKKKEKEAKRIFGDALMTSGIVMIKGQPKYGYAVSVGEKDYQKVKKVS